MDETLKTYRMRIPAISQLWMYVNAISEAEALEIAVSVINSKTVNYNDRDCWEIEETTFRESGVWSRG